MAPQCRISTSALHRWLVCSLLLLSICGSSAAYDSGDDGYVETESDTEDGAHQPGKFFRPTHEWQTIQPDDTVFTGLHYKINIATGLKEAKLMEGTDGSDYYRILNRRIKDSNEGRPINGGFMVTREFKVPKNVSSGRAAANDAAAAAAAAAGGGSNVEAGSYDLALVPDVTQNPYSLKEARKQTAVGSGKAKETDQYMDSIRLLDDSYFNSEKTEVVQENTDPEQREGNEAPVQYRSYNEIKKQLEELELHIEDEQSMMVQLMKQFLGQTSEESKAATLDEIQDLVHSVDNAIVFIDHEGLQTVALASINSSSAPLRLLGCRIITACVQNFPKGQTAAYKAGLMLSLVRLFEDSQHRVRMAGLTALSSLVRNFPVAQQALVTTALPSFRALLLRAVRNGDDLSFRIKMAILLGDLLEERNVAAEKSPERAAQLQKAGLEMALLKIDWCHHLTHTVKNTYDLYFGSLSGMQSANTEERLSVMDRLLDAMFASSELCHVELSAAADTLLDLRSSFLAAAQEQDLQDMADYYRQDAQVIMTLVKTIVNTNFQL